MALTTEDAFTIGCLVGMKQGVHILANSAMQSLPGLDLGVLFKDEGETVTKARAFEILIESYREMLADLSSQNVAMFGPVIASALEGVGPDDRGEIEALIADAERP
jgi:hypothetical protein